MVFPKNAEEEEKREKNSYLNYIVRRVFLLASLYIFIVE